MTPGDRMSTEGADDPLEAAVFRAALSLGDKPAPS